MSNQYPVEIDGITGEVEDLPPKKSNTRYRVKLDTLSDIKREMAKVYRESSSEIIEPAIGSKLIWMLQAVGKVIEVSDLESRITALESKS